MKKIRAMLAGIAVLAVVGGVFAFKAKSEFSKNIFYTTGTYLTTPAFEATGATYTTVATTKVFGTSVYYTTAAAPGTTCFSTKAYLTTSL